jgi:hypothetical protein
MGFSSRLGTGALGAVPRSNLPTKFEFGQSKSPHAVCQSKTQQCDYNTQSELLTLFLVDQDWVSSHFLGEVVGVRLESTLGLAERCTICLTGVGATLKVEFTRQIRANGLGSSFQTECGGSGLQVSWVLTSMAFRLGCNILLLGDQVVNTLFKFHIIQL